MVLCIICVNTTPAQTYLVMGGWDSSDNLPASTEIFTVGDDAWKRVKDYW